MPVFRRALSGFVALVTVFAMSSFVGPRPAIAVVLPSGFQEQIVFSGLSSPVDLEFAPDGRVFVAEKGGRIKVFDDLADTTPTVFADLSFAIREGEALGLVGDPDLIFLDEPTTGLDPRSRLALWETIEGLVADGTTVLLTTQYLDEADRLAERLAIIDHGRVIAEGTSRELKAQVGGSMLHVRLQTMEDRARATDVLRRVLGPDVHDGADAMTLVGAAQSDAVVAEALLALSGANVAVSEFSLGQPSLDEVFFALTGHPAEERTSPSPSASATEPTP